MSSATLKAQGNEHYSKQEWEKAIECYTKAIELEKDLVKTAPLLSNRVAAYLNVGDLVRAGEDAHQSIVRDKHYAKGWARKAEVDLKRGKNELAETTQSCDFRVDVEAQGRYRAAIRRIQESTKSAADSPICRATFRGLSNTSLEDAWPVRIVNEELEGFTPLPGGHLTFLLRQLKLGCEGTSLLDQVVKITASGEVEGVPLSKVSRIIAEVLLHDPIALVFKFHPSEKKNAANFKLAKLNELDRRESNCLKYFGSSPMTAAEIICDLDKRLEKEEFQKIASLAHVVWSGCVINAWAQATTSNYRSAIQQFDLAHDLSVAARTTWAERLSDAHEAFGLGDNDLRILKSRAIQLYMDAYSHSEVIGNPSPVPLERIETFANTVVRDNPRRLWPKDVSDESRLGYYVLPLAQAYTGLGFVAGKRAKNAIKVIPSGKVATYDIELAKRSARYFTLASTLLPDDSYRKAGLVFHTIEQHLFSGGKTRRQILELEDQAVKLEKERKRFFGEVLDGESTAGPREELARHLEGMREEIAVCSDENQRNRMLDRILVPYLTVNVTDMPPEWDYRKAICSYARSLGCTEPPNYIGIRNLNKK